MQYVKIHKINKCKLKKYKFIIQGVLRTIKFKYEV